MCEGDICVGEDVISRASSSENAGGLEVEMNVLQSGANVAVTQLKSNNQPWGPTRLFPSSAALCRRPGRVSKPPLSHSDSGGKRKKCPSLTFTQEIHHSVFWMWTKRLQERDTTVSVQQCACHGHRLWTFLTIYTFTSPVWHSPETLMSFTHQCQCDRRARPTQSTYLSVHVLLLSIHLVINLSAHFSFWSIWFWSEERAHWSKMSVGFN